MRKITPGPILVFMTLFTLAMVLGIFTNLWLLGSIPLGDFRGVILAITAISFVYLYAAAIYRVFLYLTPLKEGKVAEGSRAEFIANIHILFYLILFNSLVRTHFLPIPLMRLIYLALGARLGRNTYSAGAILDPPLTEVGDNTIIGHDAVLFSHAIEGHYLSHAKIRIGHNVTIGAMAIIMSGVTIEDNAIVAAGSVVIKGSHIGAGEIWGGNPAKLLRIREIIR